MVWLVALKDCKTFSKLLSDIKPVTHSVTIK